MTPFQAFFLLFSLFGFALAWLRGGHPERAATGALIAAFIVSYVVSPINLGYLRLGEAVVDVVLLVVILRLALRYDRWSLFAMAAFLVLTLVVHAAVLSVQTIDPRADTAARWGLGVLIIATLIAGVLERWLAGESAVSRTARWSRATRP